MVGGVAAHRVQCGPIVLISTPINAAVAKFDHLLKTRPTEFRLPVKYGLRDHFYITEQNVNEWVAVA